MISKFSFIVFSILSFWDVALENQNHILGNGCAGWTGIRGWYWGGCMGSYTRAWGMGVRGGTGVGISGWYLHGVVGELGGIHTTRLHATCIRFCASVHNAR